MFNSDERIAYLNLYNGEIIYNLRRIRSWPFYNTPEIVKHNKVCVVKSDKELVYMNLKTKETLWTFKSDSMIYDKIITIKDNIYLSDSKYFYCISLNGDIEWKIELGEFACSPIVEKDLLYVYVNEEGLYAINIEKRKQEWHFKNNYKSRYIGRKIIVDQNNVYFVGPYLYSIDRFTGELIGEYTNFKSTLSNRISFINNDIVAYTDSKRMIPNICILSKEGKKEYEFFTSDIFPPQSISFPFSYMDEFEFMFAENIEDNLLIGLPATVDSLYCFQIKTPIK
jgi:outer membrane protein assembly factor BamB